MALHVFVPGESALVAENLDANFAYLLDLINQSIGNQRTVFASGTSTAQANAQLANVGIGNSLGTSTALGVNGSASQGQVIGTATGTAIASGVGVENAAGVGTATGSSNAGAFTAVTSFGTATGTSSTNFVGTGNITSVGTSLGTSAANGVFAERISSVATATGTATVTGSASGGALESNDGKTLTQTTDVIFASTTPGQPSSVLNSFTLSANPGAVVVNGSNDATTSNVVELYYTGHVLYRENQDGTWFRWVSAGNWLSTANPVPPFISESVEGYSVTTAGNLIYGSSNVGVAAPLTAAVGNGLDTWTITANPGQVVKNGATDTTTANAVQLYYHQHTVYHLNSSNQWFRNTPATNPPWTSSVTPIPTTPTINVANIAPQVNTNTTFMVSGTYQAFAGPGNPTLQYADNAQIGTASTTWNPSDKSGSMALANNNITANSTSGGSTSVRSTSSFNTGKKMFELSASSISFNWVAGVANANFPLASGLGDDLNGIGYQPNNNSFIIFNNATPSSGITTDSNGAAITFCIDFTAKSFWVTSPAMRASGLTWNNSNTASPATGAGGISFAAGTGPWFICFNEFDAGAIATLNTLGPFAVSTPAGFSSWDVASSGTTWLPLPSNVNVTPTNFSFVHPPVATQAPTYTVGVRDANATGVIGVSNTFQIQTPGVVTLNPMTLDNTTFPANSASGTLVGHLNIPASGGTFTGNVTSSDSRFSVTGSGGTRNVVTTSVLGAGTFPGVVFTATMTGAVNSPESLTVTLTGVSESFQGTSVTAVGPTITGSATPGTAGGQLTWALLTGGKVSLNGVSQNLPANVTQLYYVNHTLYIGSTVSSVTSWTFYNGGALSSGQLTASDLTSSSTPIPNIALNQLTFAPNQQLTGILASLISASNPLPNTTWTEDSPSFSFQGNQLVTTGSGGLPAGQYNLNITSTIPN